MEPTQHDADPSQEATDPAQHLIPLDERERKPLARRHALRALIAGAAAAVGAALLGAREPEKASADSPPTIFASTVAQAAVGGKNTFSGNTSNNGGGCGIYGVSDFYSGVFGQSSENPGVYGKNTDMGPGVYGENTGAQGGYGVHGRSTSFYWPGVYAENAADGPAILGENTGSGGVGVRAQSSTGFTAMFARNTGGGLAVFGEGGIWGSSSANHAAVYGLNTSSGPGVLGYNHGTGGIGVNGLSDSGYGVFGSCTSGPGVWGQSGGNGGVGVVGVNDNGIGIYGQSNGGGSGDLAGLFQGKVHVTGGLVSQAPHVAAVRGTDGRLRSMHSLASPESWFEDFGAGQLNGGSATVQISADFAEVVHGDTYHVFLTAEGNCKGLYVGNKAAASFTVHELQDGTSSVSFSYRIVAKSKENGGARMQHVEEPPTAPKAPVLPSVNIPEAGGGGVRPGGH